MTEEMISGMVFAITGGYKIKYTNPDKVRFLFSPPPRLSVNRCGDLTSLLLPPRTAPHRQVEEIDFSPPWKRISMMSGLAEVNLVCLTF